jgi:RNA polymerase sigma-70 factor (ECF subfamily)
MSVDERVAEERFRELFRDGSRLVLGYALRRVNDPADAADVTAETFLVAWRRIDDIPPGPGGRLWLLGVARRVLGNQRRSELRRSALAERLRTTLADFVVPEPSASVNDARVISAAMAALDDDQREVLHLTSWEGLTPAEVATMLGIPPATARSRLCRARARLREELVDLDWHGQQDFPTTADRKPVPAQDPRCER